LRAAALQAPEAGDPAAAGSSGGGTMRFRRIPLSSISNKAAGQQEVAELSDWWRAPPLHEVRAAGSAAQWV